MNLLRYAAGACAALLATTAVACSSPTGTSPDTGTAAPAATAEPGAFPVTIEHRFGETTIDAAPTRVVTVGLKEQDDLLALGIVPVAASEWLGMDTGVVGPWAQGALGGAGAPQVLDSLTDGIPVEAVAALEPDLILGLYSGMTEQEYGQLSQIAPVVAAPGEYVDYGIPWDVQARIVGRAVGQPQRMEGVVAAARDALAQAAADNPEFAGKTALAASTYEGVWLYGPQDPRSRLLTELGFTLPDGLGEVVPEGEFGGALSLERQAFLDTDALLWYVETPEEVLGREGYTALGVHTQGRDVFFAPDDELYDPFSFLTALSLPYLLERLAPRLRAAVDGDPATPTTAGA